MAYEDVFDIKMSDDGDLVINNGDLEIVNGTDWFLQEVNKIIKTSNPSWMLRPNVGADMDEFAGQPNTREVGKMIENKVYEAITAENIHYPGTLTVKVVPSSPDTILVYINLAIDGIKIKVAKVLFDYNNGIISANPSELVPEVSPENNDKIGYHNNPYFSRL